MVKQAKHNSRVMGLGAKRERYGEGRGSGVGARERCVLCVSGGSVGVWMMGSKTLCFGHPPTMPKPLSRSPSDVSDQFSQSMSATTNLGLIHVFFLKVQIPHRKRNLALVLKFLLP